MNGAIIDDSIPRETIRIAQPYFPATRTSAERIEAIGEEAWRIVRLTDRGLIYYATE